MEIALKSGIIIISAIIAGILGRMGGSRRYNTKFRDFGVPLIATIVLWLLGIRHWFLFIHFVLLAGSLTTYFDWLFNYDNLYFSGFMAGLSAFYWHRFILRAILLALSWGLLNKYLPSKVLVWRRDVAEEFLRYFMVIITLPLLLI